jgi:lactate permease
MLALLSLFPLILLVFLLLVLRWPLLRSGLAALMLAAGIALVVWEITPSALEVALWRAVVLGLEIGVLLLGAVVFARVLQQVGVIGSLERLLVSISPDSRIQLLLIAWLFGSFLEGTAGFGIPAVIVAPMLLALGFRPGAALVAALIANSTAVVFGAVGTPVVVGLSGFDQQSIVRIAVPIVGIAGLMVPTLMLSAVARLYRYRWREYVWPMLPLSVVAGGAFVLPFWLTSWWQFELASVVGGLVGMGVLSLVVMTGWLVPSKTYKLGSTGEKPRRHDWFALAPYLLFIALLLIAKSVLPTLTYHLEGGDMAVRLFNSGLVFLLTTALVGWWYRLPAVSFLAEVKAVRPIAVKVGATILVLAFLTQLLVESSQNQTGLPSMLYLAFENFQTVWLPMISPALGALGSFLAGSITVSNLLFGPLQEKLAVNSGYLAENILALQLIGATAGNILSLANIAAAKAAVGSRQDDGGVVMQLLPWVMVYLTAITLLGAWYAS